MEKRKLTVQSKEYTMQKHDKRIQRMEGGEPKKGASIGEKHMRSPHATRHIEKDKAQREKRDKQHGKGIREYDNSR